MSSKVELVEARVLRSQNTQKRCIDDYINSIAIQINTSLKMAKSDGKHFIIEELPIVYDIPNTSNNESQRIIWSTTIQNLKNKGFNVKINPNKDVCRLKISWISTMEEEEIQQQLRILHECTQNF
jgi:hypothetical protein